VISFDQFASLFRSGRCSSDPIAATKRFFVTRLDYRRPLPDVQPGIPTAEEILDSLRSAWMCGNLGRIRELTATLADRGQIVTTVSIARPAGGAR
jgi:hypothetical protein